MEEKMAKTQMFQMANRNIHTHARIKWLWLNWNENRPTENQLSATQKVTIKSEMKNAFLATRNNGARKKNNLTTRAYADNGTNKHESFAVWSHSCFPRILLLFLYILIQYFFYLVYFVGTVGTRLNMTDSVRSL